MRKLIQITSGRGPQECNLAVQNCLKAFEKEASNHNISLEISRIEKDKGITSSVDLKLIGKDLDLFLASWLGTILWICKSPIRPQHKRKNWFIRVCELKENQNIDFDESKIQFETMRSAGPGGQNVNKVNTAVRACYIPNNIAVQVMESRSQLENKRLAVERLREKVMEVESSANKIQDYENWTKQIQIERGNPIRTYEGLKFVRK